MTIHTHIISRAIELLKGLTEAVSDSLKLVKFLLLGGTWWHNRTVVSQVKVPVEIEQPVPGNSGCNR